MTLRQEISKEILEFYDDIDTSGKNTERMRTFLDSFKTDVEFYRWAKIFYEDVDQNFKVAYKPFENNITVDFIESIGKKHGIPLYEIVYMPYLNGSTDDPPGTLHPIMVLDFPVKRLKQMVFKKNHTAVSITKRNAETGQVTDSDKTARITDTETYSLIVQNQTNAAKEFYGPRADDMRAKSAMLRNIQRDGEASIRDLPSDPLDKVTLNTLNYYMIGSCLMSNMVDENGYMLPITLQSKESTNTTIKR